MSSAITLPQARGTGNALKFTEIPDPGDTKTFDLKGRSGIYFPLKSAGAETRTLATPPAANDVLMLQCMTYVGDITVTVTNGFDEADAGSDDDIVFSAAGQFVLLIGVAVTSSTQEWRVVAYDGVTGPAVDLAAITADTLTVSGRSALDGNTIATTAGTGITTGSGTVYNAWTESFGGIIKTSILIQIDGLVAAADGDIIGKSGTANCHIGQITAAASGTIFNTRMTCLNIPVTGELDIDLFSATPSDGTENDPIGSEAGQAIVIAAGLDWASGAEVTSSVVVPANAYLYLVSGGAATAEYASGLFLIELYGTA